MEADKGEIAFLTNTKAPEDCSTKKSIVKKNRVFCKIIKRGY